MEDVQMTELSIFDSKTIPCFILVDENVTDSDLKYIISESKIKVIKKPKSNSDSIAYCNLSVDNVL